MSRPWREDGVRGILRLILRKMPSCLLHLVGRGFQPRGGSRVLSSVTVVSYAGRDYVHTDFASRLWARAVRWGRSYPRLPAVSHTALRYRGPAANVAWRPIWPPVPSAELQVPLQVCCRRLSAVS